MERMLRPAVVAVVGASREPRGLGHAVLRHLTEAGFSGRVVAVHPEVDQIAGVECVRRLSDVGGGIDLAVVVVPADQVLPVVEDAAAMVQALAGQVGHWYLAGLEQAGRGQEVDSLAARLDGTVAGVATGVSSGDARVADALARAIAAVAPGGRVLVFGSFHTVAEALQALRSGH